MSGTTESGKKLIYIAGYGRSGSTILGILLGAHEGYHHMGAVAHMPGLAVSDEIACSCGKAYRDCPEWHSRIPETPGPIGAMSRRIEAMPGHRSLFAGKALRTKYQTYWTGLLSRIRSDHNANALIDTSKTSYTSALRPMMLRRRLDLDVYVILLVRDARDVMNSKLKGNNNKLSRNDDSREMAGGLKGLIGWLLANTYGLVNCLAVGRQRHFVVYYDDLMTSPHTVLAEMQDFLGDDLSDIVTQMGSDDGIDPGHLVGGNRLARREKVRFAPPSTNHKFLKPHHHALYWVLTQPLNLILRGMRRGRVKTS